MRLKIGSVSQNSKMRDFCWTACKLYMWIFKPLGLGWFQSLFFEVAENYWKITVLSGKRQFFSSRVQLGVSELVRSDSISQMEFWSLVYSMLMNHIEDRKSVVWVKVRRGQTVPITISQEGKFRTFLLHVGPYWVEYSHWFWFSSKVGRDKTMKNILKYWKISRSQTWPDLIYNMCYVDQSQWGQTGHQ